MRPAIARRWPIVSAVVLLCWAAACRAELRVGTTSHTTRILRESPPPDAGDVHLAAGRNEVRSFQILVRSDARARIVGLECSELRGPGGSVIAAAEFELYREHQLHLTAGTYRNDAYQPGWYPDALVPFVHPLTRKPLTGARICAVPFDLPAGETHGFWIDIHVPADAKAGEYRGTCRLVLADGKAVEIPVTLLVWDFALPRVSTLHTAFGSPAAVMRGYYRERAAAGKETPPGDWAAVEAQCADLLSRHRLNATPPSGTAAPQAQADGSFLIPAQQVKALAEFIDRYHVNAVQVPNPSGIVKDPQLERAKLHAWLAAWDRAAAELGRPGVLFYTYLCDEPNDQKAYQFCQTWGKAIREARSVVKVMVVEQTLTQDAAWGDLNGAVDIWCPLFCLHDPATAAQRQALGEIVWTYTALCQGKQPSPWWHIDYPLLNYRVPAWIAWRYRMRGLLYWGGMSYWRQVEDPWTDPWTYGKNKDGKGLVYNSEGTLVYPARPAGYDGIVPSMRLKALRDAVEDYEYMAILDRAGRAAEADKIVMPLAGSFFAWDKDPAAYGKARAALAELIVAGRR